MLAYADMCEASELEEAWAARAITENGVVA